MYALRRRKPPETRRAFPIPLSSAPPPRHKVFIQAEVAACAFEADAGSPSFVALVHARDSAVVIAPDRIFSEHFHTSTVNVM